MLIISLVAKIEIIFGIQKNLAGFFMFLLPMLCITNALIRYWRIINAPERGFGSGLHSFYLQQSLFYEFCSTRLYSEISLCKSNLRLAWITILSNQIASIASEHGVINFTF